MVTLWECYNLFCKFRKSVGPLYPLLQKTNIVIPIHYKRQKLTSLSTTKDKNWHPYPLQKTKIVIPIHYKRQKLSSLSTTKDKNCHPYPLQKTKFDIPIHYKRQKLTSLSTTKDKNCHPYPLQKTKIVILIWPFHTFQVTAVKSCNQRLTFPSCFWSFIFFLTMYI